MIYKIYYVCGIGRKSLKYIRQREIAEAFYEVCIEEELENASISKVATRLNINPSLIIHYFDTRGMSWFFSLIEYNLDSYTLLFETAGHHPDSYGKIIVMIDTLFSKQWNVLFDEGVFLAAMSFFPK